MDTALMQAPYLVGFILPPLIEVLNKDIPQGKHIVLSIANTSFKLNERHLATLSICLAVAVMLNISNIQSGSLEQVLASFGLIFTESQSVYKLYFENSGLRLQIQDMFAPKEDVSLDLETAVG